MPFALINPDEPVAISINGNAVTFKRLAHGDNLRLMNIGRLAGTKADNSLTDEAADIMAKYIIDIDLEDKAVAVVDAIKRLHLTDFLRLMGEMTASSTLSEGQIKN